MINVENLELSLLFSLLGLKICNKPSSKTSTAFVRDNDTNNVTQKLSPLLRWVWQFAVGGRLADPAESKHGVKSL